jgi:hypothetical protein
MDMYLLLRLALLGPTLLFTATLELLTPARFTKRAPRL